MTGMHEDEETAGERVSADGHENVSVSSVGRNELLVAVQWALLACFSVFMIRYFLLFFSGDARPKDNMKLIWHTVKHLVEFWH